MSLGAGHGDADAYIQAVAGTTWNRSAFIDADGRAGVGSLWQKIGDKVCILFGASTPVIMRQEGEYWRLIGDAYVHGIMTVRSDVQA